MRNPDCHEHQKRCDQAQSLLTKNEYVLSHHTVTQIKLYAVHKAKTC